MSDVWGGERLIGNTIVRHLREVGGSVGGFGGRWLHFR